MEKNVSTRKVNGKHAIILSWLMCARLKMSEGKKTSSKTQQKRMVLISILILFCCRFYNSTIILAWPKGCWNYGQKLAHEFTGLGLISLVLSTVCMNRAHNITRTMAKYVNIFIVANEHMFRILLSSQGTSTCIQFDIV